MGQLRVHAAMVGVAAAATLAWSLMAGCAAASATTRLRSGNLHAQLVSHVTPGASSASSGLQTGPDIMGGVVGALAVLALTFLIVTYIWRRVTPA